MSATCILWYMLHVVHAYIHDNTGLSKHGDPMFPHQACH